MQVGNSLYEKAENAIDLIKAAPDAKAAVLQAFTGMASMLMVLQEQLDEIQARLPDA